MSRIIVISVLVCALGACRSTATIYRTDGRTLEAPLVRSDRDLVYVQPAGYKEVAISRIDIREVDHPGNVMAVAGTSVAVVGALSLIAGAFLVDECDSGSSSSCDVGWTMAIGGGMAMTVAAPFGSLGWSTWIDSTSAEAPPIEIESKPSGGDEDDDLEVLRPAPVVLHDGQRARLGAQLGLRW